MLNLFAQAGLAYGIGHYAIIALVIIGIIGVLYICLKQANVVVPAFLIQILWVVAAVVIGVIAIKFLLTVA